VRKSEHTELAQLGAAKAIVGGPVQLQLRSRIFWPVLALKRPLPGRAMGVCNAAMMEQCR
jgi:hypothetical protein